MSVDSQPVIRIVKKKKGHSGHHGGAWKVAYADFVTAMMAFFLVMWIVGLSKPIREAVASYFRSPSGFMKTSKGNGTPLGAGEEKLLDKGKPAPLIPMDGGKGELSVETRLKLEAQFKLVQAALEKEMEKELEKSPEFRNIKESVEVTVTEEGLRIELMEKTSALFFDPGSAALKPRIVRLLQIIARELREVKNPIIIEGHTDSRPLGRAGYTNWELSADRANSARRAIEAGGLHPNQILAVRGYADRKPKQPNDPSHFMNRRVSILVAYTAKSE